MRSTQDRLAHLRLRGAVLFIVVVATALSIVAAVLQRMVDPSFDTFGDSLWWAVETVSTVGYGDVVPESAAGKGVAAALMLVGIGFIPVLTSVVVSVLVAQRAERERAGRAAGVRQAPFPPHEPRRAAGAARAAQLPPVVHSAELGREQRHHVVRLRIAAEHLLLEDQLTVDVDVEDAAGPRHELDRRDVVLVLLENPRRQTDGVREGASGDAVLDPDVRERHPPQATRARRV